MEKRDIAVIVQNLVQFYSIKAGIDELLKLNYIVDIYVPKYNDGTGIENLYDETYEFLSQFNYSIKREKSDNILYKILLEPYPVFLSFNCTYRIKYKYAPISAKPNLTLKPECNIYYDCILCYSPYEEEYLKVYSNTKLIRNLKYIDFKKRKDTNIDKKVLLYLPTYGDTCSVDLIAKELEKLKNKYYIITKSHHGTSSLIKEEERIDKLKVLSDEYYDHTVPIRDLLEKSDVVLSDNSGSIFEAIYTKTPVAIFSKNPNENKIGKFNTIQYRLIKDNYIPCTDSPSEISNVLDKACSKIIINKQLELRKALFYWGGKNSLEDFINVIKDYLFDNINNNYKDMHDVLINDYSTKIDLINKQNIEICKLKDNNRNLKAENDNKLRTEITEKEKLKEKIESLKIEKNNLNEELQYAKKTIEYYEKGKLYQLSKKIYKLYYKIKKRG